MMKKSFFTSVKREMPILKRCFFPALIFLLSTHVSMGQLASWNPAGLTASGPVSWAPLSTDANVTVTNLTKGSAITSLTTSNAWGGANWLGGANQDGTFTITANAGYQVSLSSMTLFYRRSGTGPANGSLQYKIGSGSYVTITAMNFPSSATSGAAHDPIDLSGVTDLQNVPAGTIITLRLLPVTTTTSGSWYVYGSGLQLDGTVIAACNAPTGLAATGVNASSANLNWDIVPGASGYEYVLDMSATDPAGAGTFTPATSYPASGLLPSTTYYMHVRTDCGSGDFSNWISTSFTTNPPCADPTSLAVNSFNATSTDISWDSETGITGFEYVLDMTATDPTGSGTATTANVFSDNTLTPSTTYYFHLRKDCGSGDFSDWIDVSFTTNPPCADPTSLTVNSFNSTSTDISWDSETGITGFEYVLDMSSTDPAGAGTATTGNTFMDNTLTPATTYYFHLRKDCGSGDFSDWIVVSFTTPSPCSDPTGLGTSAVDHMSATLVWDNVAGITGFEYVLDMSSTDPTGAGTATTATTFTDNTLAPVTTYYFHLRKNCGSGDFSDWVTLSFTTLSTPTSVLEMENENIFRVSPNPTNGRLQLITQNTGGILQVTDLAGKVLSSVLISSPVTTLNLENFEAQVYLLVYQTTESRQVSRIVKQ